MQICANTVADPDANPEGVPEVADLAAADLRSAGLERGGLERVAHRRRVAELCRRTARCLGVKGPAGVALVLAATEHSDGLRQVLETTPLAVPEASDVRAASFESLVAEMAETILRCRQGLPARRLDADLDLAVRILDACDEFDDAVELAVLDRTPIPVAINEFFDDAGGRFDRRVFNALRQITSPGPGRKELAAILTDEMPFLPASAMKLIQASAGISVAELELIAASDPVLGRVLIKASGSTSFGSPREIPRLGRIIARVGVPFARKLLLAACFGRLFASRSLAALWEHSKIVAIHAHELAAECGYDQDIAFVAGMLHDIGRLITHRYPPAARLEEDALRSAGFPLTYAECLIYGTDHAAIGSSLLKRWNLPAGIVEAVAFHHSPENTKSVLASLLSLAEDASPGVRLPVPGWQPCLPPCLQPPCLQSEAPWRELRRAAAAGLTGIHGIAAYQNEQKSAIWSLAS